MGAMIPPNITDPDLPGAPGPDDAPAAADSGVSLRSLSQWELAWRKFRQHRLALVGLGLLFGLVLAAIVGPIFIPFTPVPPVPNQLVYTGRPPFCVTYDQAKHVCTTMGLVRPFGETGGLQADVLMLVLNGARTSLFLGFTSMAIGVFIGTILGAVARYAGGVVDNLLMRLVGGVLSLPPLFVLLVVPPFFKGAQGQ